MGKMHHEENIFVCPGVWECGAKKDKTIIQKITDISAMRQELNRKLALLEIIKGGQSCFTIYQAHRSNKILGQKGW